jgi:transporter family protein
MGECTLGVLDRQFATRWQCHQLQWKLTLAEVNIIAGLETEGMTMGSSWQVFALGSAFFAGLTAILGKVGVAQINSNLATLIRTVVILAVTAAIVTWRSEWEPWHKLSPRSVVFLCLSGLATGLSWLCYYRALQLGPASRVAPLDKLSLAFVIVLAWLFLGEPLTWKVLVGGTLVVAGALTLATN